jgi:transposase
LPEAQVREIRRLLETGHSASAVAKQFNVSNATIYSIATRRSWAWLK